MSRKLTAAVVVTMAAFLAAACDGLSDVPVEPPAPQTVPAPEPPPLGASQSFSEPRDWICDGYVCHDPMGVSASMWWSGEHWQQCGTNCDDFRLGA